MEGVFLPSPDAERLTAAAFSAPSALVGARLLTSLGHAAYFGIGSMLAASLVPRDAARAPSRPRSSA